MEFITIDVPIRIPKPLYQAGAVEAYAKLTGWTPKVLKEIDGVPTEIDNPISAKDWGIAAIQTIVKNQYREIIATQGAVEGRAQAEQQFDSMFSQ